jgi:hypothetical protein
MNKWTKAAIQTVIIAIAVYAWRKRQFDRPIFLHPDYDGFNLNRDDLDNSTC